MRSLNERPTKPCSGNIFQIQRWSVHDGEGIRSTVFLKGCPLRCKWCANPESWNGEPEVLFFRERCTGCGHCVEACPSAAVSLGADNKCDFDREKCVGCGKCCEVCPSGARKMAGTAATVDDVLKVIKRDAIFYRESGGGVTFSGGEPFAQPEFLRQLVSACKRLGVDTAVETCGQFSWKQVADIVELLDCVFVDIKHMDDAVHKALTRVGNRKILENIKLISQANPNTIVRVPLIEGVNTSEQNIREMCEFLRRDTRVDAVELLPYHDIGTSKYAAAGASAQAFAVPDAATIEKIGKQISTYGIRIVDFK